MGFAPPSENTKQCYMATLSSATLVSQQTPAFIEVSSCITAPLPFREHPCHSGWVATMHSLQACTHKSPVAIYSSGYNNLTHENPKALHLNGVCWQILMKLKTSFIRGFFSHHLDVPWGWLMQTHCDHSVATQALQVEGYVSCMGLMTDRGNSRYGKRSSCRLFETW